MELGRWMDGWMDKKRRVSEKRETSGERTGTNRNHHHHHHRLKADHTLDPSHHPTTHHLNQACVQRFYLSTSYLPTYLPTLFHYHNHDHYHNLPKTKPGKRTSEFPTVLVPIPSHSHSHSQSYSRSLPISISISIYMPRTEANT